MPTQPEGTALVELKLCPFCGASAYLDARADIAPEIPNFGVACDHAEECPLVAAGDHIPMHFSDTEAITAWNTRTPAMPEEAVPDPNGLTEVLVPMPFERPVGDSIEMWRENVRKTDLYRNGDTVLVWVNEGDICNESWGPFVKRLLKPHEIAALSTPPATKPDEKGEDLVERLAIEFFGVEAAKAAELLKLVASEHGCMDAEDERLNPYCDDMPGGDDTINLCFDAQLLVQRGSEDNFTCELTAKGRKFLRAPGIREAVLEEAAWAAVNAKLPAHFQWSESNRRKFEFGVESAVAAIRALTTTGKDSGGGADAS